MPVLPGGAVGAFSSHITHEGNGPTDRQKLPHVHCTLISPDNKTLLVPDLGIDKVMLYQFDAATGKLTQGKRAFTSTQPGSGPRHRTLSQSPLWLPGAGIERNGECIQIQKGKLKQIQRISTMPAGDNQFPGSADIHVSSDGKFLYASNRSNSNTIAIFSINKKGKLTLAGHQSNWEWSRNFNVDPTGKFLLVGNQNSDEIVIFERNPDTGLLKDTGKRIALGKPVCIKWIPQVKIHHPNAALTVAVIY